MKKIISSVLLSLSIIASGQNYFRETGNTLRLDNGMVTRVIKIENDSVISMEFKLNESGSQFIDRSEDFSLLVNDKKLNGYSGWNLEKVEKIKDENEASGAKITITGKNEKEPIKLEISYLLYPELPIIRKRIKIYNTGTRDMKVEALDVESLVTKLDYIHTVVHHNYARMEHLGKFVGNWDDPLVVVHDMRNRMGLALGNESIGVLKRTAFHTTHRNIEIGLTHPGQDFPFRKWIKPGQSWESPATFICLYDNRDDAFQVVNNEVNRFIVKHMKPRILELEEKPVFIYNSWYPFRTFVNDTLIDEVAEAAAECGIEEFIIDDGWQVNYQRKTSEKGWGGNYGDWLVDENKFRGGLKPTFDHMKELGMKPGLWISIGSATGDAKVFTEHPEWFVEDQEGKPGNIHFETEEEGFYSASFGTDWYDYIKETILRLVKEYGLMYAKLDLAVVASPYVNNPEISGSWATDHPFHKDHEESFIVIYERVMQLFDELHEEAPDLFIDCTFETAGKLQMMDYAIAEHAEGNWLSNFEEPAPLGPLRIRQMAWWRSPVLPASSLVIGNQAMNDPGFEFSLKSLIGTLPIVLGDPRELSDEKKARIREWAEWMRGMQEKYDYMTYRKDLPGFGEPAEGHWDGWQRINFDTREGGIIGVFRQGALEDSRQVFVEDLWPDEYYSVKLAPEGTEILQAKGRQLMEEGFLVAIKAKYDGTIYEIRKL